MDDEEDLSLEHDWECDKKCNTCEMRELCEKLEEERIGNSVVPIMAQKLAEANCPYLKVGERIPNMSIDDSQE